MISPNVLAAKFLMIQGSLAIGVVAVISSGVAEIFSVTVGLLVVAVAGIFTIRSNVAKIWREQAEGEKARNVDLVSQLAETLRAHADVIAKMKIADAEVVAELHRVASELEAANLRTDLTGVMKQMADHHAEVISTLLAINNSLAKGLVNGANES